MSLSLLVEKRITQLHVLEYPSMLAIIRHHCIEGKVVSQQTGHSMSIYRSIYTLAGVHHECPASSYTSISATIYSNYLSTCISSLHSHLSLQPCRVLGLLAVVSSKSQEGLAQLDVSTPGKFESKSSCPAGRASKEIVLTM